MKKIFACLLSQYNTKAYWICIFFISALQAYAQNITNENSLFIPAGMEIYTDGDLVNVGFFQNNGSFTLKGSWSNQNVYQGTGMVVLEGNDQTLFNNNQAIEQLVINGGGLKRLTNNLMITKAIDFNAGILMVKDGDTLCISKDATVNGGSNLSYVDGAILTQGNGYKFFPVGKNGKYHPVEMLDVEGISPTIEMEVFENLPAVKTTIAATLFQDIYWTRKTIEGRFDRSPITFGYEIKNGINLEHLIIAEGKDFASEFYIKDNVTVTSATDLDIINSTRSLTESIFALGELIGEPPRPYYLSTTLSSHAGNPENRTIKVFGDNINPTEFYFQVFNRWGQMIFESDSFTAMTSEGWDGRQNGNSLPSGVYPFSVKYIDASGRATQNKGFITIVE